MPILSSASWAWVLMLKLPAPVKENWLSAPVVFDVTCRPTSVALICTTAADSP